MGKIFIPLLYFFFSISFQALGQTGSDSSEIVDVIPDTVVIIKEPVVIYQTYYVKSKKGINNTTGIQLSMSGLIDFHDYFESCESCKELTRKNIYATKPLPSYNLSLSYLILKRHFFASVGFGYSWFSEKISGSNGSSYRYSIKEIGANAKAGIRIGRKKLSTILTAGLATGKVLKGNAFRFKTIDSSKPESYNFQDAASSYNLFVITGVKFIYTLDHFGFSLEPFYQADLVTLTQPSSGVTFYRNFTGVNVGLIKFIK
jgi:hypothetical protein